VPPSTLIAPPRARNRFVIAVILAGFSVLAYRNPSLPAPSPASAPADTFSSERALRHVSAIAREPHPVGSEANRAVREYIGGQIRELGLTPVEQTGTGLRVNRGNLYAARVTNIMARIEGTANTRAVMLAAHFDSVANGPGAADDGHGVGVLLETLRALKNGPPLKNDVIALFTDGEEADLLGAEAFVAGSPWRADAGVVLNFEARGTRGVPVMFETSDENGRLVREFAKAAPRPNASSLTYEIYKFLPNDTDLTVFKRSGDAGLNFAFIENYLFYHSPYDDPAHLDPPSVEQQGDYALALARHFGSADLLHVRAPNVTYFTVPVIGLIVYPVAWVWPLAILAIAAAVCAIVLAFRSRILSLRAFALALAVFPVAAVFAALIPAALWYLVTRIRPAYTTFLQGDVYNHDWYIAAFEAVAFALASGVIGWRARRGDFAGFAAAALVWTSAAAIGLSKAAPGASYLLVWPLLFASAALAIFAIFGPSLKSVTAILISSAVPIILIVALIPQFYTALGIHADIPVGVVTIFLLGLVAMPLAMLAGSRWLPWCAAAAGLICLAGGILTSRFDPAHPRQNSVFYALNSDNGKAMWASSDAVEDEWTSQFLGAHPRRERNSAFLPPGSQTIFENDAPALSLPAPVLSILTDQTVGTLRVVTVKIGSPRQARVVNFLVSSDAPVLGGEIDRVPWKFDPQRPRESFFIRYEAFPADGVEMTFMLRAGHRLNLRVLDESSGLPQLPGLTVRPRADWMMRGWSFAFGESTVVGKNYGI